MASDPQSNVKCTRCRLYKESITRTGASAVRVVGKGNLEADIMIVGDALAYSDVNSRNVFSSDAGQLARQVLRTVGITDKNAFFTNACKCYPSKSGKPGKREIKACQPYLVAEIRKVKPKVIVAMGSRACESLGISDKVLSTRGSFTDYPGDSSIKILTTYHPRYVMAAVSYSPRAREFAADCGKIKDAIGGHLNEQGTTYHVANTVEKVQKVVELLLKQEKVAFDTETDHLDFLKAHVVDCTFSFKKGTAIFVPWMHSHWFNEQEQREVGILLKKFFENPDVKKIAQNGKFDVKVLAGQGIHVQNFWFDTMTAHYMLDENGNHSLDILEQVYTDMPPHKDLLENFLTSNDEQGFNKIYEAPIEDLVKYASMDADATFRVYEALEPLLKEEGVYNLFMKVVMPMATVLAKMEVRGIQVDRDYVVDVTKKFQLRMKVLDKALQNDKYVRQCIEEDYQARLAKQTARSKKKVEREPFNFKSTKSLRHLVYDVLECPMIKMTKASKTAPQGNSSTDAETLEQLSKQTKFEVLENLLKFRKAKKMIEYILKYKELAELSIDGRIHTTYLQRGTRTGRLASNNPNLQNVPSVSRDPENARLVRNCLVAKPNYTLIEADYSQMEFRVWADNSNDESMIQYINDDTVDIHRYIASQIYGIPMDNVTDNQRSFAKTVVYGMMYGRSTASIAGEFGLSHGEAERVVHGFYKEFPRAAQWMEDKVREVNEHGFVKNMFGRRRRLEDIYNNDFGIKSGAERQARNFPIQSAAADIIYIAMIKLDKALEPTNAKMLLTVHDSIVVECPKTEVLETCTLMKRIMTTAVPLKCKLAVDFKVAERLGDAEKYKL